MEFGSKLKELEMTNDEVERLSKALRTETFRKMLNEYAEEISNPENKRRYEEDIAQLEQERGVEVKFIHPIPHHVLKTSVDGKEKCFINVCSNSLINKPTCVPGRGGNGQRGQQWSLPYSLTPGRPDRDNKGKKCTTYDVVFHPDALRVAGKDPRLMKLVNDTALQGVEGAFKVKLDGPNAKPLKMPYKGAPYAAVLRKAIPGEGAEEPADTFPIPYPETARVENRSHPTAPTRDPSSPTEPSYAVKYRSTVDLQDYRRARDSAPGPRPEVIVVTVDLPLLKSAADVDLDVAERTLTLESRKPAYRLDLELSYPVDEDRGDAKFNKAKKQLTITLPVKPSTERSPCGPWGNILDTGGGDDDDDGTETPDRLDVDVNKPGPVEHEIPSHHEARLVFGEPEYRTSPVEVHHPDPEPPSSVRADAPPPAVDVNDGDEPSEQKTALEDGPALEGADVDFKSVQPEESLPCERTDDEAPGLKSKTTTGTGRAADIHPKNVPREKDEVVHRPGDPEARPGTGEAQQRRRADGNDDPGRPAPGRGDTGSSQQIHNIGLKTPAVLREKIGDGGEVLISDHTTAAALAFRNSLWSELD